MSEQKKINIEIEQALKMVSHLTESLKMVITDDFYYHSSPEVIRAMGNLIDLSCYLAEIIRDISDSACPCEEYFIKNNL